MNDIRVNPQSIQSFDSKAERLFGQIRKELDGLVADAVAVNYYGPNAEKFKVECGQMASDFANALTKDLKSIATAVETSTSNISRALGGSSIVIQFEGGTIKLPDVPSGDGSVGINVAALESLKKSTNGRFAHIAEHLDTNLTNLTSTDWTGQAKTSAVQGVRNYTAKAKTKVEETKTSLGNRISKQIEHAKNADQG